MRPDVHWQLPDHGRAGETMEVAFTLAQAGGTKVDRLCVALLCETLREDGGLDVARIDEMNAHRAVS